MKLQFSSIPYPPTIGYGDRSVRIVELDQKVIELFRPCRRESERSQRSIAEIYKLYTIFVMSIQTLKCYLCVISESILSCVVDEQRSACITRRYIAFSSQIAQQNVGMFPLGLSPYVEGYFKVSE